jgi:hypothetical protein
LTLAEKGRLYNNTAGLVLFKFDTCLDTYCLLVWLLKQQPASISDSRRDFVISSTVFAILERHRLFKQKEEHMPAPFHHKDKAVHEHSNNSECTLERHFLKQSTHYNINSIYISMQQSDILTLAKKKIPGKSYV